MIYYFKGAQILAPLSITSNEPVYDVDTVSLSKQRASQGAQRWELTFNTLTTKDTEADMLVGMVTGITTADTMVMPQLPSVAKANTSGVSLPISAGASGGASSVNITSDGVISKGSFIKFSNHDKIYMVTESVGAGAVSVSIYPLLRTAVTTSHTLLTSNNLASAVLLRYYRDVSNVRGLTFTDGILSSSGTVELLEAIA
ncbi:hypothetical protein OAD54_01390 [Candidatus Pelagibacter sp.]|nr:hypothetical protein [Candidatus Pelagibacter sp.]